MGADEEDPPENNGNPHSFHSSVQWFQEKQSAQLADHFTEQLPQNQQMQVDVPDQACNVGSVVQESATAKIHLLRP